MQVRPSPSLSLHKGKKDGKKDGKKGEVETTRRLLAKGMPPAEVAEAVALPLEEAAAAHT